MSRELVSLKDGHLTVTSFYGGEDRGQCIQITGLTRPQGPSCGGNHYVELTREDVGPIIKVLNNWLNEDCGMPEPKQPKLTKYSPLWGDLNTLLSFLRSDDVVGLVRSKFAAYNNNAPAELLQQQMDKIQRRLDDAEIFSP